MKAYLWLLLVGPIMGLKDLGKVRNRRVAKSQIVLLLLLLIIIILIIVLVK